MNDRLSQAQFEIAVARISQVEDEVLRTSLIDELDKYVNEKVEEVDETNIQPLSPELTEIVSQLILEEAVKAELNNKSPEELLQERLNDPDLEAKIIKLAVDLKTIINRNWFDLKYIMTTARWTSIPDTLQRLNMMKLKGRLLAKMIGNVEHYCIVTTAEDKIMMIAAQIQIHENQIATLKADIRRIKEKGIDPSAEQVDDKPPAPGTEEDLVVEEDLRTPGSHQP